MESSSRLTRRLAHAAVVTAARFGDIAGWLALLLLVLALLAVPVGGWIDSAVFGSEGDEDFLWGFWIALAVAVLLLLLAGSLLPLWLVQRRQRARRERARLEFAPRLHGIDDWLVQGYIQKEEHATMRANLNVASTLTHEGEDLALGGRILSALAVSILLISLPTAALASVPVADTNYCRDVPRVCGIAQTILGIALTTTSAAVIAAIVGIGAWTSGQELTRRFLQGLEDRWQDLVTSAGPTSASKT